MEIRKCFSEDGGALAGTLAVVVVVTLLVAGGVYLATQGSEQATAKDSEQLAQEAAESGLNAASGRIEAEDDPGLYDGGADDSVWSREKGGKSLALDNSKVRVTISYAGEDSDGIPSFDVQAAGQSGAAKRVLQASIVDDGTDSWGPVAVDDSATTTPGRPTPINVLLNDYDPDGQILTLIYPQSLVTERGAKVKCETNGICTYLSNVAYDEGVRDSFEYTVSDPDGQRDSAEVSVEVIDISINPPVPPAARDDREQVKRGKTVTFNVLSNDTRGSKGRGGLKMLDKDADDIRGTLRCQESGQCSYTPPLAKSIDREVFHYEMGDSFGPGNPERAKVTLDVVDPKPVPEIIPPVAVRRCMSEAGASQVVGRDGALVLNGEIGDGGNFAVSGGVSGTKRNDTIVARETNAVVDAGNGSDIVYIHRANSIVRGGAGVDLIVVGTSKAIVDGGPGDDLVCVDESTATVTSNTGDDIVRVSAAMGTVEAGSGEDRLAVGGGGDSKAVVSVRDGRGGDRLTVNGSATVLCESDTGDTTSGCPGSPAGR